MERGILGLPKSAQELAPVVPIQRAYSDPAGTLFSAWSRITITQANTAPTSQTLLLVGIALQEGVTINSIGFHSGPTGATVPLNQIFGIYDDDAGTTSGRARALLAKTFDDTTTAWAAQTLKILNLTSPYTPSRTGFFYLGFLVVATTMPNLYGSGTMSSVMGNRAPFPVGNSNTLLLALPDPAAAQTVSHNNVPWCGVF